MNFTIIIPAYNEAESIGRVLDELLLYAENAEIIVVDDCSTDNTAEIVQSFSNVKLVQQPDNQGPIKAIIAGVEAAAYEVVVTMDADGQHPPDYIQSVTAPVLTGKADLVLGVRKNLPRLGERIIALMAGVSDATTGLKAMKKNLAREMQEDFAYGGVLVVRAKTNNFRVMEVPIEVKERISGTSVHSNINILKKALQFVFWRITNQKRK